MTKPDIYRPLNTGPHAQLLACCPIQQMHKDLFREAVAAALDKMPTAKQDVEQLMDRYRNMGILGASELWAKICAYAVSISEGDSDRSSS